MTVSVLLLLEYESRFPEHVIELISVNSRLTMNTDTFLSFKLSPRLRNLLTQDFVFLVL